MSVRTIKITSFLRRVPIESKAPKTTSSQSSFAGFTLIEVLVVLGIIAMIMTVGLPAIQRITYQRVTSQTRKFVGIIRTIRNDSILLNSIQRLVIDMDHKAWWVETQQKFQFISNEAPPPPKKGKGKDKNKGQEPTQNFTLNDKYSKKPVELPSGVIFSGVLKEGQKIQKEGVAYIHFFPNGYIEQTILYFAKDGTSEDSYSLLIRPTSGKVDIANGHEERFD
jgi:prepilin-type N-terminal cleavage/methylation domain-containing protein